MDDGPRTADGVPFTPGMALWDADGLRYDTPPGVPARESGFGRTGDWSAAYDDFRGIALAVAYSSYAAAMEARRRRLRADAEAAVARAEAPDPAPSAAPTAWHPSRRAAP